MKSQRSVRTRPVSDAAPSTRRPLATPLRAGPCWTARSSTRPGFGRREGRKQPGQPHSTVPLLQFSPHCCTHTCGRFCAAAGRSLPLARAGDSAISCTLKKEPTKTPCSWRSLAFTFTHGELGLGVQWIVRVDVSAARRAVPSHWLVAASFASCAPRAQRTLRPISCPFLCKHLGKLRGGG